MNSFSGREETQGKEGSAKPNAPASGISPASNPTPSYADLFMHDGSGRPLPQHLPFPANMNIYPLATRQFGGSTQHNHTMSMSHPGPQMHYPPPSMTMYPGMFSNFVPPQMMHPGGSRFMMMNNPYGLIPQSAQSMPMVLPQGARQQHGWFNPAPVHQLPTSLKKPPIYATKTVPPKKPHLAKKPRRKEVSAGRYGLQVLGADGRIIPHLPKPQKAPPISDETKAKQEAIKAAARKAVLLPSKKERLAIMSGTMTAASYQRSNKGESGDNVLQEKLKRTLLNEQPSQYTTNPIHPSARHKSRAASKRVHLDRCNMLYQDPKVKITKEQIQKAIPTEASAIFHILDRRINFDAHEEDASMYSLLRSWVQDDPFRYTPPGGSNLLEYISLPSQRRVEFLDERDEEDYDENYNIQKVRAPDRGPVDLFAKLRNMPKVPAIDTLRASQVIQGLKQRKEKRQIYKKRQRQVIKGLKRLGIDIVAIQQRRPGIV